MIDIATLKEYIKVLEESSLQALELSDGADSIRMEKPFVAREVQIINRLLELVKSGDYDNWIYKHVKLLLPEAAEVFSRELDNFLANREAVKEVDKILQTISAK